MRILNLFEWVLNLGVNEGDSIQRIRLIRQVNGLNLFYTFVAGSVSVIFLFIGSSMMLELIQVAATFLYVSNIILTARGRLELASNLTIFIFELHMFGVMLLTNAWQSPAIYLIILYPLLAALVEVPIMLHLGIGLLQAAALFGIHIFLPWGETELIRLSSINETAKEVLSVMAVTYIPVMAAAIMWIIFRENVLARLKQKEMLSVISAANRQLEIYAGQLKDETQRLKAEVDVARKIQTMVLPTADELSRIRELDVACIMRTAVEVGGDYYDIIKIGDKITITMGDVTGHGLSSGIIMLMAQTAVRTLAEFNLPMASDYLPMLNRILHANITRIRENRSMTMLLITYEKGRCRLSGQHESVIICRGDGRIEILDTLDNGFYIGMTVDEDAARFTNREFSLEKGDLLFLYSDGVTEAENESKKQFGLENVCRTIGKYHGLPAQEIINKFMKDLYNYVGDADIYDDISMVAIKQR